MAKEKENKVKNDNKRFMKDVKAELKKVTWPTSKQMVNNVTAVLVIVLVTAAIVFGLDFVFGAMNKYGVDKIKENVQSKNQTQIIDNSNVNSVEEVNDNTQSAEDVNTDVTVDNTNTETTVETVENN